MLNSLYLISLPAASSATLRWGSFSAQRNSLLEMLSHYDTTKELGNNLPLFSAYIETEAVALHTSNPDSSRRRGGHAPCECPEGDDTLSLDCLDRRLILQAQSVHTVAPIRSNITELRTIFAALENRVNIISNDTSDIESRFVSKYQKGPGLIDRVNQKVQLLRRLTEAMTACVSSVWIQHFGVTERLYGEMDQLEGMVMNDTQQILDWFSRMQKLEEYTTNQNALRVLALAQQTLNVYVGKINFFNGKNFESLAKLEHLSEQTFEDSDKLSGSLRDGADLVQDRMISKLESMRDAIANSKTSVETEFGNRVMASFTKSVESLIRTFNTLSTEKMNKLREATLPVIAKQSRGVLQDLLPRITNATFTSLQNTENSADTYMQLVRDLKDRLDVRVNEVLRNRSDEIQSSTSRSRAKLDSVKKDFDATIAVIRKFANDKSRKETELAQKVVSMKSKVMSEVSETINKQTDVKMNTVLSTASNFVAEKANGMEKEFKASLLRLQHIIADAKDEFRQWMKDRASNFMRTTSGLRKTEISANHGLQTVLDQLTMKQGAATNEVMSSVDREIGSRLASMGPLDVSQVRRAMGVSQQQSSDQVRLYTMKTKEAVNLASTRASSTVNGFLEHMSIAGREAENTQSGIGQLIYQNSINSQDRSGNPQLVDSSIRDQVSASAYRLANAEDGAQSLLLSMEHQIPKSLDSVIQSNPLKFRDALNPAAEEMGHIHSQFDNALDLELRSLAASMDSIREARNQQNTLSRAKDMFKQLGGVGPVMDAKSMFAQYQADMKKREVLLASDWRTQIMRAQGYSDREIAKTILDAQEEQRTKLQRSQYFAKTLKKFIDAVSPDLAIASADLIAFRDKAATFFTKARSDVTNAVNNATAVTRNDWEEELKNFTRRLAHRNETYEKLLHAIGDDFLGKLERIPAQINTTVDNVFEAFSHQEDVLKVKLLGVEEAAVNETAVEANRTNVAGLNGTMAISDLFKDLRKIQVDGQKTLMDQRLKIGLPAPIPFPLVRNVFSKQKQSALKAQAMARQQMEDVGRILDAATREANNTLATAKVETFRSKIHQELDARAVVNIMNSTDNKIQALFGETDDVVKDYQKLVDMQGNKNKISADVLYDQLVATQAEASNTIGRIAYDFVNNRNHALEDKLPIPKLQVALVRQQAIAIGKLFEVYNKGTGMEGMLDTALHNLDDTAATILHATEARLSAVDHEVDQQAVQLDKKYREIGEGVTKFQTASDDVNTTAVDLEHKVDVWRNTTLGGIRQQRDQISQLKTTAPEIQGRVYSSLGGLVKTIESSLRRSLSLNDSLALNKSLDSYMAKLNLTVIATNVTNSSQV